MPTLTITFHSDWRVGTGTGLPGDLDDLVRRDDDGLPMVPGRTLTGMLRDGCEQAATALGGTWPAWVDVL
ncbi:MAG: RAMP superfamily CRISPR-associated protein, partial [Pseudonocardia sp.]|nr:RAMP superfamily CRISPR-associated protein [Pseudonocardia sp.]